jgi:3-isopropylmalate/(R)-2-methylmalate dehydratase large subunit
VKNYQREYGETKVENPGKTYFTFDLCAPACSIKYADSQQICRQFARKQNIKVYDVDRGIGSHVLIEEGLSFPGSTAVGTDSHMNILGAVGCFGQGMGDVDVTFTFKTGKTWFEIPSTVKVNIKGKLHPPATAKDLTLYVLRHMGTRKAGLKAVEFYGEAIESLTFSERMTLCSMVTEMAGIIGFIPGMNEIFREEMKTFFGTDFVFPQPDTNASYEDCLTIDIDGLLPQVAAPFSPVNVKDVFSLKDVSIDSGFIGSCTNGRAEDIMGAAEILKGRKIKQDVMLKIVPSTREVSRILLEKGTLEDLFQSGAIVSHPGCGGCAEGHIGLTGEGEVQISTGNRNFPGKQGKGKTYLASPEVVAASCLTGKITSPEDL